jgi:hypothetical protein
VSPNYQAGKHIRFIRVFLIIAIVSSFVTSIVEATPIPMTGIFVFSSLCFGVEDAVGDKIVLIREGAEGTAAIYWRTEGSIMEPLLSSGSQITIDDKTGTISMRFVDKNFPGEAGTYLLRGTISAEQLILDSNIQGTIRLPRVKQNEPQQLPKCSRKF